MININEISSDYRANRNEVGTVNWDRPGLKITRLRMVSDPDFPYWDISYCHGVLDGEDVRVRLPFHQVPKAWAKDPMGSGKGFIVNVAKKEGVYAKGTGILDTEALSYLSP